MFQTWLEFNRSDRGSTAYIEYVRQTSFDSRSTNDFGDLLSKVMHMAMTLCIDGDFLLVGHSWFRALNR
jgi:hypothetical protein